MGLLRDKDAQQDVLIIKNNLTDIEVKTLVRKGMGLWDTVTTKCYSIDDSKPIRLIRGKKITPAYLVDGDRGVTVTPKMIEEKEIPKDTLMANIEMKRSEKLLELSTNPDLVGSAIDADMLKGGFKIKADMRQVFYGFLAGGVLFGIIGLMI